MVETVRTLIPTQALLDAFTLKEQLGDIAEKNITILGDILYSRVARSNMECLLKLGAKVTIAGPSTLVPSGLCSLGRPRLLRFASSTARCGCGHATAHTT